MKTPVAEDPDRSAKLALRGILYLSLIAYLLFFHVLVPEKVGFAARNPQKRRSVYHGIEFASANFHLLEADGSGFEIYRSGMPSRADIEGWCRLGISEVMVLAGNAADAELRYREACPELKVVFNTEQHARQPNTAEFLAYFDEWVAAARQNKQKVVLRCYCGCHRAGRLSAYYQLKYLNTPLEQVLGDLLKYGETMEYYPYLILQILAYEDYIAGRPCRFSGEAQQRYCVIPPAIENVR